MSIIDTCRSQLRRNLPFVVFRKPQSDELVAYFQEDNTLYATEKFETPGFVFAPFDLGNPTYIFPENRCSIQKEAIRNLKLSDEQVVQEFDVNFNKSEHIDLVSRGIQEIQHSSLDKVVLSRIEKIRYPGFDVMQTFVNMLNSYQNAFVYVWFHPKEGMWMGASPELLIQLKDQQFRTVALASTQSYQGNMEVVWGDKEKEEHSYVVKYLKSQLSESKIREKDVDISPTYTVKAGNLLHLRTDISGILRGSNIENILRAIHPTPAVCGYPEKAAKKFILEHESYAREFYTGFLGQMQSDLSTHLYVNLRCLKIIDELVCLYVGGGITSDSIPEKEWEETVNKAMTMKSVMV